ncbi:class I SAM-dependent methyltransferase [Staphylococcus pasteuri]|uniref:class I SAM-dependent methyltransferase n=1 Tax=Staphylococcus pasteuri TaxID=45972 RepID=UPI0015E73AC6|nr:class I SAM-dependent methyltransferase [Staphylococcus pasteuri]
MIQKYNLNAFDSLHEHSWGFAKTRVIMTSFELQIFDVLEKGIITVDKISEYLKCNRDGIKILLNALKSMNVLEEKDNEFYIKNDYKRFVLQGSEYYIGYMWKMYEKLNWDTWKNLTYSIKNGEPANKIFQYDKNEIWNDIIPYLDSIAKICANEIVETLKEERKNNGLLLDLGCGSAIYSKVIIDKIEDMKSVCVDQKNVIEKVNIEKEKLKEKIIFVDGDFLSMDYEEERYDIVLLSNIVHGYNMDTNKDLIQRCYNALKPGGVLLINDFFSKKGNDLFASLFNIHSFLIGDGQMFSLNEIMRELNLLGMQNNKIKELSGPFTLIYAFK